MKRLHCINNMYINVILILFLYTEVTKAIDQSVTEITEMTEKLFFDKYGRSLMKFQDNGCECIKYDCGCCEFIQLDPILNGTLCANASYLEHDYGISVTVTYNDIAIINATVSARNPPPICIGQDIVDFLEVEICLQIYDIIIDVNSNRFHACFKILMKILKLKFMQLTLGCIDNNLSCSLHEKKTYSLLSVVIMVQIYMLSLNRKFI